MSFLYGVFLKLFNPASLCLLFLFASALWHKRKVLSRGCFWSAVLILMVCGNGWLVGSLTRHLEWSYLPPNPVPQADCILVLSGGVYSQLPPRPTIELGEAGDRILYGAFLFRQGKAPFVICTGGAANSGPARRPAAADMADLLGILGVPEASIITESRSSNTHEHALNLYPLLQEKKIRRVLLVTSALHMPRSFGTFKRLCPGIEFVAAPTDFQATQRPASPWYYQVKALFPTPGHLMAFSEAAHEYAGIAYYWLRGWL